MIKKVKFSQSATIKEVQSGSGLFYTDEFVYVVSDKSNVLYKYDNKNYRLKEKISLKESGVLEENLEKKIKPDFEACASLENRHYIFGSGSAENRFEIVVLNQNFNFLERRPIENLYRTMMEAGGVDEKNFNIEGVILKGKTALFFNRGNGPAGMNGIFTVEDWQKDDFKVKGFTTVILPEINGFPSGFSDAILIKDRIYFLATAEDSTSVYDDGEVMGSAFGILDSDSFELKDFKIVTNEYKLEGMAVVSDNKAYTTFIVCDDNDDAEDGFTDLFSLNVNWNKDAHIIL